jgi:hypothetical protein
MKREPASPIKSFLPFEKLYLIKIIELAINITETEAKVYEVLISWILKNDMKK